MSNAAIKSTIGTPATRLESKQVTALKRSLKRSGYRVNVLRIGTGRWQQVQLSGPHAEVARDAIKRTLGIDVWAV